MRRLAGIVPFRAGGFTPRDVPLAAVGTLVGLVLLAVQIALGGWTSANYAALACGTDFPKCAGAWWPEHDFAEGFVLWRGIGVDYEGGVLDNAARVAIQLAHRMMAVLVRCPTCGTMARLLDEARVERHETEDGVCLIERIDPQRLPARVRKTLPASSV